MFMFIFFPTIKNEESDEGRKSRVGKMWLM